MQNVPIFGTLEFFVTDFMTPSTAAVAILVLLDGAVFAANMFVFSPEIVLMTSSAEGCVLW
jgi:hypothetical protein